MANERYGLREDNLGDPFFDSVPEVLGHIDPKLTLVLVDAFPQLNSSELTNLGIDNKYKGIWTLSDAYILVGR